MKVVELFQFLLAFGVWLCVALVPAAVEWVARRYADVYGWQCHEYPVGLIFTAVLLVMWFIAFGSCIIVGADDSDRKNLDP